MPAIDNYAEFLWNCLQFDINVFSHGWMYYYLLVPAIGYFLFFILKWIILTIPMWMPLAVVMRLANIPSPKCRTCAYKVSEEFDYRRVTTIGKRKRNKRFVSSERKITNQLNG
jgi:hypothetical protein